MDATSDSVFTEKLRPTTAAVDDVSSPAGLEEEAAVQCLVLVLVALCGKW